jgi:hypothetical protein
MLRWETAHEYADYPLERYRAVSGKHEFRIFYGPDVTKALPWKLVVREVSAACSRSPSCARAVPGWSWPSLNTASGQRLLQPPHRGACFAEGPTLGRRHNLDQLHKPPTEAKIARYRGAHVKQARVKAA